MSFVFDMDEIRAIERPSWADDPIGLAWWDFHCDHPEVYRTLSRLADEWLAAHGRTRKCGMKMLWERLRWEHAVGNVGGDFKLNNNYTSLYARYIMEGDEFADLFDLRERRCEVVTDKPDPPWRDSMFTAYHGCPDAPECQSKPWCRASGDCKVLADQEPED